MTVNPAPPPVTALLLDLDDTLYDSPAMKTQVASNIQAYMVKYLGVPQEEVYDLCYKYVGCGRGRAWESWQASVTE